MLFKLICCVPALFGWGTRYIFHFVASVKRPSPSPLHPLCHNDLVFPWTSLAMPSLFLPIRVIRLGFKKMLMRKSHGKKPEPRFQICTGASIVPTNFLCQNICFAMNFPQYFFTDFFRACRPHPKPQTINFPNTPKQQTMVHIFIRASHAAACSRRNTDPLF